ncbi:SAM-dependent methyltransferase [Pararhodobacter zhoushanensis]|uniref:Class I SAM-dependent methyltransferase n=1 Tax=Pararhodobacter zhoushanensis TaxID=2479545 RepID=A0ABT3H3U4_9RHOB|nr:class I SAM-dependent methyltransferase [Pararhodobacter zhoushanensis]MCW1934350.1 class I SAM-dependent methyltransferase [Pararhodobacter zhoushanensis]
MWENRYSKTDEYLFGTAPALFLTENPWLTAGVETALSVADGEGRNGVQLARAGLQVTSFDLSPTAVGRAKALAEKAGVTLDTRESDWQGWDWDRQFDLVVGIFIQFMPPAERPAQFANLARAVKPGGRLALHGYTPEQVALGTGGPPTIAQMWTPELLVTAFPGWRIERLAAYERDVQEGRGHSGRSALIDFVATRP